MPTAGCTLLLQPLPRGEQRVCKQKGKLLAGAVKRASGDRPFALKRAEGGTLSLASGIEAAWSRLAQDRLDLREPARML